MLNQQLLKNIRALRLQKGLTQGELGRLIGRDQAAYNRFESGAKKTDYETLERVAEALSVDVCTLIRLHEEGLGDGDGASSVDEGDLERLRGRERYLVELNERLIEQIRDKEDVISLLREGRVE